MNEVGMAKQPTLSDKRPGDIRTSVDCIEANLGRLADIVDRLLDITKSASRSEPPLEATSAEEGECDLSNKLYSISHRIDSINVRLHNLNDRIEL